MKLFIDTNVFISAIFGEEERSEIAKEVLKQEFHRNNLFLLS